MSSPLPPWLSIRDDAVDVRVKVVPRSSREGVAGVLGDRLKINLHAPPVEGEANRALSIVVADLAGVAAGAVTIAAGTASRSKTVRIATRDPEATARQLREAAGKTR